MDFGNMQMPEGFTMPSDMQMPEGMTMPGC
jgi:hypothetical protein